eukprot:CAMPEP_0195140842 /NCGR_PEP_ID=MMETSP0448-20130528/161904_1 /TAXON_ID=66468 /ORGANISM="Heterocapsa triquestra, Strain CCMP 448" /LENGTH=54 /DNA_ID=CAMNT_0040179207 /DNA_START=189 /DNA_END=353 /DNA_ORIENTATION=+
MSGPRATAPLRLSTATCQAVRQTDELAGFDRALRKIMGSKGVWALSCVLGPLGT